MAKFANGKPLLDVTIIPARCEKCEKPFGIRAERTGSGVWKLNWAFKENEGSGSRKAGSDLHLKDVNFFLDPQYPGCPYCSQRGLVFCPRCKTTYCMTPGSTTFTCPKDKITSGIDVGPMSDFDTKQM